MKDEAEISNYTIIEKKDSEREPDAIIVDFEIGGVWFRIRYYPFYQELNLKIKGTGRILKFFVEEDEDNELFWHIEGVSRDWHLDEG